MKQILTFPGVWQVKIIFLYLKASLLMVYVEVNGVALALNFKLYTVRLYLFFI